jgi:hypothetical protein
MWRGQDGTGLQTTNISDMYPAHYTTSARWWNKSPDTIAGSIKFPKKPIQNSLEYYVNH